MRKYAAIAIMLAGSGAIISGCDQELLQDLGLVEPPKESTEEDTPPQWTGPEPTSQETPSTPPAAPANPSPPVASNTGGATTPSKASAPAAPYDFVPRDALTVTTLYPRKSSMSSALGGLPIRETLIKMGQSDYGVDFRAPGMFLKDSGAFLDDIEQVVLIVDGMRLDTETDGSTGEAMSITERFQRAERLGVENDPSLFGSVVDGYVIRFRRSAPQTTALRMPFQAKPVEYMGETYYGRGKDTSWAATYFPDDRTIILGEERVVRRMIAASKQPERRDDVREYSNPDYDITTVFDWQEIWRKLPSAARHDARTRTLGETLKSGAVSIRLTDRPTVKTTLHAYDDASARRLESFLREQLAAFRAEVFDDPLPGPMEVIRRDVGRRAGQDLRVDRIGSRLELSLVDSFSMDDLLAALRRWGDAAQGKVVEDTTTTTTDVVDDPPPVTTPDASAAASEIRQQIPTATGIRLSEYLAFTQSTNGFGTDDFSEQTLSVALLSVWRYDDDVEAAYNNRFREFRFTTVGPPPPRRIMETMAESSWLGYCTMLQPDAITSVTCEVDGSKAEGVVSFYQPGLFRGNIRYTAKRDASGAWSITGFQMPEHGWRFSKDDAGKWRWRDAFGDATDRSRCPAKQRLIGMVTLDGKPLADTQLEFYHEWFPEWPFDNFLLGAEVLSNGTYAIELPPGRYKVRVVERGRPIPAKYKDLSRSGLEIDLKPDTRVQDFALRTR